MSNHNRRRNTIIKNCHITFPDHHIIRWDVQQNVKFEAYCHEVGLQNQQLHTHVCLQLIEGVKQQDIISYYKKKLIEIDQQKYNNVQIDVKSHKNFYTIVGYHIGLGDKEPCTHFTVLKPDNFDIQQWKQEHQQHKKHSTSDKQKDRIELIKKMDQEGIFKLCEEGLIHPSQIKTWQQSYQVYQEIKQDQSWLKRPSIYNKIIDTSKWLYKGPTIQFKTNIKKRHFWFWSDEPSVGKSTFFSHLMKTYRCEQIGPEITYYNCKPQTEVYLADAVNEETFKWSYVEKFINNQVKLRKIYGGNLNTDEKSIICMFSNYDIYQVFTTYKNSQQFDQITMDKQIKIIDSRFNVIKLNESWPDNTTMNADGTLKIGNLIQNEQDIIEISDSRSLHQIQFDEQQKAQHQQQQQKKKPQVQECQIITQSTDEAIKKQREEEELLSKFIQLDEEEQESYQEEELFQQCDIPLNQQFSQQQILNDIQKKQKQKEEEKIFERDMSLSDYKQRYPKKVQQPYKPPQPLNINKKIETSINKQTQKNEFLQSVNSKRKAEKIEEEENQKSDSDYEY